MSQSYLLEAFNSVFKGKDFPVFYFLYRTDKDGYVLEVDIKGLRYTQVFGSKKPTPEDARIFFLESLADVYDQLLGFYTSSAIQDIESKLKAIHERRMS